MNKIPYTSLDPATVAKAPYLLADEDHGIRFNGGEALVQSRFPDPCVVVKMGFVIRRHYGSANVTTVLRNEYGIVP